MASITCATTGLRSAPSTWVGGVVPVLGDKVTIPKVSTGANYVTAATGYAIGATAITLTSGTGTLVAAECVVFDGDPNVYKIATALTAGVVTLAAPGLLQAIPTSAVACRSIGLVVTVDGDWLLGDDTTTALNINGGLIASRSVSSSLTVRGGVPNILFFDFGTESNPLPAGVTTTIVHNDSAAMANGKYAWTLASGCVRFSLWGVEKNPMTRMSAVASGAQFDVPDATGWGLGDVLFLGPTTPGIATVEVRDIAAIIPRSGTAATVTLGAAVTNASFVGRAVANVSRNVRVIPSQAASFSAQFTLSYSSLAAANCCELGNVEFVGRGHSFAAPHTVSINVLGTAQFKRAHKLVGHDVVSVSGSTVTLTANPVGTGANVMTLSCRPGNRFTSPLACTKSGVNALQGNLSHSIFLSSPKVIGANTFIGNAGGTGASTVIDILDPDFVGGTSVFVGSVIGYVSVAGGSIDGFQNLTAGTGLSCNSVVLSGVDLDGAVGVGSPTALVNSVTISAITLNGCDVPATAGFARGSQAFNSSPSIFRVQFVNKDNDPTVQELLTIAGLIARDNNVTRRGTSSMRFDVWYAGIPQTLTQTLSAAAGQTLTILGATRYNAALGTSRPPSVTISGLGITPVVFTCPTTDADTWFPYTLTVVNPNAYPGDFTVTYDAGTTANSATASAWFDGIYFAPWIDSVRHFGYLWQSQAAQITDARITLTEAGALALPVAVDHALATVTISGPLTPSHALQAQLADLVQTANNGRAVHVTGDGSTFSTTYTVILVGAGAVSGPYTDATGRHVTISSPTLRAGTLVQVYDLAGASETYIGTPGTSLAVPATWSADKTLRVRAMQCGATSASLFVEAIGTLTSAGASFLITQQDDPVYAANAIDGSAVPGITIDDTLMRFALAGRSTITWGEIYAYETYWLSTTAGIRDDGRIIDAVDTANYKFRGFTLKNLGPGALTITGGWGRDATTGRTADIIDTSGFPIFTSPDAVVPFGTGGASPAEIADKVLGRNLAGSTDGGRTVRDALRANRNRTTIDGSTLTVYAEDDSTPAWSAAIVTAPRDALQSVDPT